MRSKLSVFDWNGDGKLDLIVGDYLLTRSPEPTLTEDQKRERGVLDQQYTEACAQLSSHRAKLELRIRDELRSRASEDCEGCDLSERIGHGDRSNVRCVGHRAR